METKSLLTRGIGEIINQEHLEERLKSGEKLRIKFGIDPSKPELHIGHAVPLRKLREFQELGHTTIMLFGDYTAQLGDPTDRSEARKILSHDETRRNAKAYLSQVFKILDRNKTEVRYNSEWLGEFTLRDTIELMASTTINHLLSHETFGNRLRQNLPLHMHELLYPLLQGYDSVALKADVELGGMDQKFNLLMGRTLQQMHGQAPQDIILFEYIPGTDGQAKMSKSLGNVINMNDAPEDMFGKVMSIPDTLIATYAKLATRLPDEEIAAMERQLATQSVNPRDIKEHVAKAIVAEFHSPQAAQDAATHFDRVFRQKQTPDSMETLVLKPMAYELLDILVGRSALIASKSEARRLVQQGAVRQDGEIVTNPLHTISPEVGESTVLQVGPRRFLKIEWKQ